MRCGQAGHEGVWCIDPIDGTSNFVRGLPYFAVSVALVREGRSVLGVVYDPVADEMFAAERERGAFLNGEKLAGREAASDTGASAGQRGYEAPEKETGNASGGQSALFLAAQFRREHAGLVLHRGRAL